MKILCTVLLLSISALAFSDYEVKTETHGEVTGESYNVGKETSPGVKVRNEQKPFSKGTRTSEKQEEIEQGANQDLDPELDAIDDELTEDEGIRDE